MIHERHMPSDGDICQSGRHPPSTAHAVAITIAGNAVRTVWYLQQGGVPDALAKRLVFTRCIFGITLYRIQHIGVIVCAGMLGFGC